MIRLLFFLVLQLLICCFPLTAEEWQYGASKGVITPQRSMMMSGYASRDQENEQKLSELWAKVLVLQDASGKRICLVTADVIGVSADFTNEVQQRIEKRYGLKSDQLMICSSHTHTGPAIANTLVPMYAVVSSPSQTKVIEDYTRDLQERIIALVGQAIQSLAPAKVSWGNGATRFATNRRNNRPEAIVPQSRRTGKLLGPFDHDVPVLAVRDPKGNLRVVVFGYACHATVLSSYEWSGDYPGFAQAELEAAHEGCQAMFWAGCGADQNPIPRRSVELARHYGRQLAVAVDEVLRTTEMLDLKPRLATRTQTVDLRFDELPDETQLRADLKARDRFVAGRARLLLDQIEAGKALAESYPYPVTVWKLGDDIQWIGLGGEVVVDFALRLKRELRGERTWVAAYTNDVMAYIPSRRVWDEGGYEGGGAMVYYGLPTRWAPNVEETIIRAVHESLAKH